MDLRGHPALITYPTRTAQQGFKLKAFSSTQQIDYHAVYVIIVFICAQVHRRAEIRCAHPPLVFVCTLLILCRCAHP